MTQRTLAIMATCTCTLVLGGGGGCLGDDATGPATTKPAIARKPVAPVLGTLARPPVEGILGERLLPVKLPATKGRAATEFRFGRENQHKAWLVTLPEQEQLVTVAYGGGKIFVGGGFSASTMYAFEAQTGKQLWSSQTLADPGPTAPVFDNDELAFNTFSCSLEVLNASTGKRMWSKNIGSETPIQPAMSGDLVIAPHPDNEGGYALTAYKRKTGAEVWTASINNHVLSAPVVAGDSVYVTTLSGSIYRIGLDGKRRWQKSVEAASAPWIDGDDVHLAVREGANELQVVLAAADGKRVRTVTTTKSPYDAPSEAQGAWSFEGSRPIVVDGVRYVAMGDRVEAREAHSDALRWTRQHGKADGTRRIESVIVAGSLAIVTTRDGKLVGLDRETGAQRLGFDFGTPVTAQPVIANGWMYIATQRGQVLAFDLGNRAMDGWHMWGGNAQHNRSVAGDGPVASLQ